MARQAGPVWIDLPAHYRDVSVLTFHGPTAGRRLTLSAAPAPAPRMAAPRLFAGLEQATDDCGRDYTFEVAPAPRAETRVAVPAGERSAFLAEAAGTAVRTVDSQQVIIRVQSSGPDPGAQELAEQVARSVRPAT